MATKKVTHGKKQPKSGLKGLKKKARESGREAVTRSNRQELNVRFDALSERLTKVEAALKKLT